jgi:phosphoglycolate phosphatase
MIEFVMFDADGVLFDSTESNVAYYNFIFKQVGEPPLEPEEEISAVSFAAAEVFAARTRGNAAMLARMQEVARTMDQTPFFRMLRPALELRPFMLALKTRYKLGLATNRSATVPALVEHLQLDGIFDAIASALDKVPPKPAPDILRLCLKRANVAAPGAVYVGDSRIDREAAERAGVHFIGVGNRIEHHSIIETIATLSEPLEALEKVLSAS